MNVEALITYLAEWAKKLIKAIEQTLAWFENLGAEETTTDAE